MNTTKTLNPGSTVRYRKSQLLLLFGITSDDLDEALNNLNIEESDEGFSYYQAREIGKFFFYTEKKTGITCVTNDKGGVGKTLNTYTLCNLLALRGKKVLVIDLDGQRNLTSFFMSGSPELTFLNYFQENKHSSFENIAVDIDDSISIIPSNNKLGGVDPILDEYFIGNRDRGGSNAFGGIDPEKLLDFVNDFTRFCSKFDEVIIDSTPSFSISNQIMFSISTRILAPIEPERFNIGGINAVTDFAESVEYMLDLEHPIPLYFCFNNRSNLSGRATKTGMKVLRKHIEKRGYSVLDTGIPFSEWFYFGAHMGVPFWLFDGEVEGEVFEEFFEKDKIDEMKNLVRTFSSLMSEIGLCENSKRKAESSKFGKQKSLRDLW